MWSSPSSEVPYTILFETTSGVDNTTVKTTFNDGIENAETVVPAPTDPTGGSNPAPTLEVEDSKLTAVVPPTADELCDLEGASICNETTSTCAVLNGTASTYCQCNEDYYQVKGTTTQCAVQFCTDSSECNGPFGECIQNNDVSTCKCIWGLSGARCKDPWLLVAVVLAGFFGLCFIITATIYIVRPPRKVQKKKKYKKDKPPPYEESQFDSNEQRDHDFDVQPHLRAQEYNIGYTNPVMQQSYDDDVVYPRRPSYAPPVNSFNYNRPPSVASVPSQKKYYSNHQENRRPATEYAFDNSAYDDGSGRPRASKKYQQQPQHTRYPSPSRRNQVNRSNTMEMRNVSQDRRNQRYQSSRDYSNRNGYNY